jgi:3-oxoadipate enol-lactonase
MTRDTETGFVEIDGGRMYYEATGAGSPLVLLHADVADLRMWDDQMDAFTRRHRVVRVDKRGFGRTTSESGTFSSRRDILALLDHLHIATTAILGLSNGGSQAVDFTIAHPDRVTALIAIAGGVSGFDETATPEEIQLFGRYQQIEGSGDMEALIDYEVRLWGDGPNQPEGRAAAPVREKLRQMIAETKRDHHETLTPEEMVPPAIGRLGEIRIPTLVVIGGLDFSGVIAAMETLAAGVTGAQKALFPGCAHMVNMEQPERFNETVEAFLSAS